LKKETKQQLLNDPKFAPDKIIQSLIPSVEAYIAQLQFEGNNTLAESVKKELTTARLYLQLKKDERAQILQ